MSDIAGEVCKELQSWIDSCAPEQEVEAMAWEIAIKMIRAKFPAQGEAIPSSDPDANKVFEGRLKEYLASHPKALTDEINAYSSGWIAAREYYAFAPDPSKLPKKCKVCGEALRRYPDKPKGEEPKHE